MAAEEFAIRVSELDSAGKSYAFPVRSAWIRGALEGHEATTAGVDGKLAVRASKSGHDVVVHGTLDAALTVPCARCLEPTTVAVHSDLSVLYVPGKVGGGAGEGELSPEEANTLPFDGETVVLDDLVRDELILEIPMIPLCSEDCPGMSPGPAESPPDAAESRIDPRLRPLLDFAARKSRDDKSGT